MLISQLFGTGWLELVLAAEFTQEAEDDSGYLVINSSSDVLGGKKYRNPTP